MNKKNCVIFYNEVMGYTEAFIEELTENFNLTVIHWGKEKKLTTHKVNKINGVKFIDEYNLKFFDGLRLLTTKRIDLLIVNGWTTKKYIFWSLIRFYWKCPCVVTLDSQINSNKIPIYRFLRFTKLMKVFFTHALVAGPRQSSYAEGMGFAKKNILYGFLSADHKLFNSQGIVTHKEKIILYVGRIDHVKGIKQLLQAWSLIHEKYGWSLKVIGGLSKDWDKYISENNLESFLDKSVKHEPFKCPIDISKEMKKAHAFVLPSNYEPWGVVMHEAALSSCFLIATKYVGASDQLVRNNVNGIICDGTVDELHRSIVNLIESPLSKVNEGGKISLQIAKKINYKNTAKILNELT